MVLTLFAACDKAPATEDPVETTMDVNVPLSDGKTLKVLAIGNSFSNNTTKYLYDVAKAQGATDIAIGRLYISGCSLQAHVSNAESNAPAYEYSKNTDGNWNSINSATLLYALQDEDWDIITLQQNSGNSGKADTFNPSLELLIDYVNKNKTNPNARLVWNMTWAYQTGSTQSGFAGYNNDQMTMYKAILDAVQTTIIPNKNIAGVIPVGTAVQNARTSFIGDNLTKDTYHLNDLGCVLGAYAWYTYFIGQPLETVNLESIPGQPITEQERAVIKEAVNAALETPYAITESANK